MKLFSKIGTAFAVALLLASCGGEKTTVATTDAQAVDSSKTEESQSYTVDAEASTVKWRGSKKTGDEHYGTIKVKEGSIAVKGEELVGGTFVIDMNSFVVEDLKDEEKNQKLSAHLKSEDFFLTEKFPEATFTITEVAPYKEGDITIAEEDKQYFTTDATHTITGNLKMRGEEKSIKIPAKVSIKDGSIEAEAKFNIDRTLWGVNYNSDESIADKFINKAVNLDLKLSAKK